jgi:hypothetical protein
MNYQKDITTAFVHYKDFDEYKTSLLKQEKSSTMFDEEIVSFK